MIFSNNIFILSCHDLRTKALEYIEQGKSQKEASIVFGVSYRTIWNWILRKKKGILQPKKYEVNPRKIDNDSLIKYIKNITFFTFR